VRTEPDAAQNQDRGRLGWLLQLLWPYALTAISLRRDHGNRIRRTTIGCVGILALIAGTVSYLHMHLLVEIHGQPGWVAALTSISVDGMIVAASTRLLADSRSGGRGGFLAWALLVAGSAASLAANVAVAEPTVTGRVIAGWPSFSLIAAYELLMRRVRRAAETSTADLPAQATARPVGAMVPSPDRKPAPAVPTAFGRTLCATAGRSLRVDAWLWAQEHKARTARCPRAQTSPGSTADMNGGDDWSSTPGWQAS
jgi:Protein of unknown function (DUF2637)